MAFGTDARATQTRFRASLSPAAREPSDDKGRRHGHLLALGHEIENLMPSLRGPDEALAFFRDRGIKWWKSSRSGDDDTDGPTRNLASSQVACVNFLLPLARIPGALRAALQAVDPDVEDVLAIVDHAGRSSPVEIEWVGWSEPLEGGRVTRGANRPAPTRCSSRARRAGNRAYVFEWKYCEEYLRPEDKGAGRSGDTRRSPVPGAVLRANVILQRGRPLRRVPLRAVLPVDAAALAGRPDGLRRRDAFTSVVDARVVVVCPAENQEYRNVVASTPLARRFPATSPSST